jgi:hypothetical protein
MADNSDRVEIERIRAADRAAQREARAAEQEARREAQAQAREAQQEAREKAQKAREKARDDARYGGGILGDASRFLNEDLFQPITSINRGGSNTARSRAQWNNANAQMHRSGARSLGEEARLDVYRDNADLLYQRELQRIGGGSPAPMNATYAPAGGYIPAAPTGSVREGQVNGNVLQGYQEIRDSLRVAMMAQRDGHMDLMHEHMGKVRATAERMGPDTVYRFNSAGSMDFRGQGGGNLQYPAGTPMSANKLIRDAIHSNPAFEQYLTSGALNAGAPAPTTGTPAPQTGTTAPVTQPGAPASQTPPSTGTVASSAPATITPVAVAQGKKAHAFNEKFPALNAAENQIMDIQKNLIAAGFEVGPNAGQADGKSGRRTWTAFETICTQAGIDPKAVDFKNPNDPELMKFNEALTKRIAERRAPAAQQGPSEAELATQREVAARAQAAAAARAKAEADAREIPALLNSPFDSRNIAALSDDQRYELARTTLLGIGELKHENKDHKRENMHDKMKEAVRDANKLMGEGTFRVPTSERDAFSDDAMAALGVVAAREAQKDAKEGHVNPMALAMAQAREQGALNSSVTGGQDYAEATAGSARGAVGPLVQGR